MRGLLLAPRRVLDQSCRAFADAAPEAAAAAPVDAGEGEGQTKSQRQKQAKAEAAAKAANAKPAPPDFIGKWLVSLDVFGVMIASTDATLASFEQNGSRCVPSHSAPVCACGLYR